MVRRALVVVMLAMWVAARLLGSPGLEVVAIGIAVLPLLAAWATKRSARRILVRRRLSDVRVSPGTRVQVSLELENASPIPTSFLLLEDRLPTPLGRAARLVMGGVDPSTRERAAYTLVPQARGRYMLGPLVVREILYRLLCGEQGARLRQIALGGGMSRRVGKAIDWLRRNFAEPLRIDDLAEAANMSPSALHHHFKSVTAMSPLQYQKQLRLQEARRLMLGEGLDAAEAAFRVGYESPSQFSREYRRLFGAPPRQDVAAVKVGGLPAN